MLPTHLKHPLSISVSVADSEDSRPLLARLRAPWHLADPSTPISRRTHRRRLALCALGLAWLLGAAYFAHAWVAASQRPPARLTPSLYAKLLEYPSGGSHALAPSTHPTQRPAYRYRFPAAADELGALVGFMAAFASNALPTNIDPTAPLDPQLVLGFEPRDAGAAAEVRELVAEAWRINPVVVLSELKTGNLRDSREMKSVVEGLRLYPDPTIIEVDQRVDRDVIKPLLQRLTGAKTLPVAIVGGKAIASMAEFRAMAESGSLNVLVTAAGAIVNGKKGKGGRKH